MAEAEAQAAAGAGPTAGHAPPPADALIIVPVRGTVLFPGLVLPVTVGRPGSVAAAQQALREQRQLGILLQRHQDVEEPGPADLHQIGCVANLMRYVTAQDGTHHLACQGEQRFNVLEYLDGWPFLVARVVRIPGPRPRGSEGQARVSAPRVRPRTASRRGTRAR